MKAVENVNEGLFTECWKQMLEKGGEMEIFSSSDKLLYIYSTASYC